MNEVQLFNFQSDVSVRVMMIDGNPWWVAKDVCEILGLDNVTKAIAELRDIDKRKESVRRKDNLTESKVIFYHETQKMNIVNESGLYRLIFKSIKPIALTFQDWIFDVVIPSIRKTGKYSAGERAELSVTQAAGVPQLTGSNPAPQLALDQVFGCMSKTGISKSELLIETEGMDKMQFRTALDNLLNNNTIREIRHTDHELWYFLNDQELWYDKQHP